MKRKDALRRLAELKPRLAEHYGVRRLGVFGSTARDEATEGSDVDVVVELVRPDLFLMVHLKEELEAALGVSVDVLRDRDSLAPGIRNRIEKEAVYV